MCPAFRRLDAIFGDRDGGNHSLRADSTSENAPWTALMSSLNRPRQPPSGDDSHGDEEDLAGLRGIPESQDTISSWSSSPHTSYQAQTTTPSVSSSQSQQIGPRVRARSTASTQIDSHAEAYIALQQEYQRKKLELAEHVLAVQRKKAIATKFAKISEHADRLLARNSDMTMEQAFQKARDMYSMMEEEG